MNDTSNENNETTQARRKFLATCGRFAVVTPPAVTLMLAASRQSFAVANSSVPGGHNGGYQHKGGQQKGGKSKGGEGGRGNNDGFHHRGGPR